MFLIAVGKLGHGPERAMFERYAGRLRPALSVREVGDARGGRDEARRREGAALLAALPPGAVAVALDESGAGMDSAGLARALGRWRDAARQVAFLIGGADGHDPAVLARADLALSLGAMTWPHLLVRVMLAEQLFRSQSILSGHPYHRGSLAAERD